MDCITCEPDCGKSDDIKDADNCNLQAEKHKTSPTPYLSQAHYDSNTAVEKLSVNGFVYEKCKFCGSIIARRVNPDSIKDDDGNKLEKVELVRQPGRCERALPSAGDEADRIESARAYGLKLSENGCGGICIQYDTRSCKGNRCKTCEVHAARLCCKRYLINSKNSNVLERDGGDYRNLMGDFIRCYKEDNRYDEAIRRRLYADAARVDAYRDEVRRHVDGADDAQLIFEWREYTLDDLLVMIPHIIRRPVRIEIQLLIYLFYNYRYPVDLEHAETRFHLPKRAINRYLRSYFGYSYSSLLAKIRNEHSKILLGIPLLRIGEISTLVGYKTLYHFSLNFKRYEGLSPKEYRQLSIGGAIQES